MEHEWTRERSHHRHIHTYARLAPPCVIHGKILAEQKVHRKRETLPSSPFSREKKEEPTCTPEVTANVKDNTICAHSFPFGPDEKKIVHPFDKVFSVKDTHRGIYDSVVAPLVDTLMRGVSTAVLLHGPSGSGKTFTAFGSTASHANKQEKGLLRMACEDIMERTEESVGVTHIRISAVGIQEENMFDLLSEIKFDEKHHVQLSDQPPEAFPETAPKILNIKYRNLRCQDDLDEVYEFLEQSKYNLWRSNFGKGPRYLNGPMHIRTESLLVLLNLVQSHYTDLLHLKEEVSSSFDRMAPFVTEEEADTALKSLHRIEEGLMKLETAGKRLQTKISHTMGENHRYLGVSHLPTGMSVVYDIDLCREVGGEKLLSRMRFVEIASAGSSVICSQTRDQGNFNNRSVPTTLERCLKSLEKCAEYGMERISGRCRTGSARSPSSRGDNCGGSTKAFKADLRDIPHRPSAEFRRSLGSPSEHMPAAIRRQLKMDDTRQSRSPRISSANNSPMKLNLPFRESKLTKLLQGPLSGACEVAMLATLRPEPYYFESSLRTLEISGLAREAGTIINMDSVSSIAGISKVLLRPIWNRCVKVQQILNNRVNGGAMREEILRGKSSEYAHDEWFSAKNTLESVGPKVDVGESPTGHNDARWSDTFEPSLPSIGDVLKYGVSQNAPAGNTVKGNSNRAVEVVERFSSSDSEEGKDFTEGSPKNDSFCFTNTSSGREERRHSNFYGTVSLHLSYVDKLLRIVHSDTGQKISLDPTLRGASIH